jgi:hypothetical protein
MRYGPPFRYASRPGGGRVADSWPLYAVELAGG